ncbi:MAG: hypothetical protein SXG53_27710, partial [Pseudomonadota bacterium]|nr:hypothetical protein [Pseudomonadota bacterium]
MNDGMCLQRLSEAACREPGASRNACEAWLRRLESDPARDAIERQLARGWVYMFLADFATVNSLPDFGSVSEIEAREFKEKAASIFRNAAAEAPTNIEALGSLVAISDSSAERIRLLRRIVTQDPEAFPSVELLVSELLLRSDTAATYLEAAELLERAYDGVDFVPKRWYLATRTLEFYERSGSTTKRDAFRTKWAGDVQVATAVEDFASNISLQEKRNLLSTLCDSHITAVFGNSTCLEMIELAMAQLPSLDSATEKLQFSEFLVSVMAMVAETVKVEGEPLKETY